LIIFGMYKVLQSDSSNANLIFLLLCSLLILLSFPSIKCMFNLIIRYYLTTQQFWRNDIDCRLYRCLLIRAIFAIVLTNYLNQKLDFAEFCVRGQSEVNQNTFPLFLYALNGYGDDYFDRYISYSVEHKQIQ